MSDDSRYAFEDVAYTAEKPAGGKMRSCLIGCLWTLAILAVLGTVLGVWVARNWRTWVADRGAVMVKQNIEALELPEQEKDEIGEQVDRVATAFRKGEISQEQVTSLLDLFFASPLATSLAVELVEHKYFEGSDLSDEEKVEARRTLRRFARGSFDKKIDAHKRNVILRNVIVWQENGNWHVKDNISNDELRQLIAEAELAADEAGVEDEPAVVDVSDEVRRIIDEALAAPPNP